jgi:C-terminal processing protease CtpA/Prc
MKASKFLALCAAILVASMPAHAGGGKCTSSTQECLDYMATKMKDSGWVGVELDVDEDTHVMTVTKVVADSPAEGAGIQPGDVLFAINGIELNKENEKKLSENRKSWKPGSSVTWTMRRDGNDRDLAITMAPMPADVLARYVGTHMLEHAQMELAASDEAGDHEHP